MLKKMNEIKEQLLLRRAYITTKTIPSKKEAKALDDRINELNELIQYVEFYNSIPDTFEEFSKSGLKEQIIEEFQKQFFKEKRKKLKGIYDEDEIEQIANENQTLYQQIDQVKKLLKPNLSKFHEETMRFLYPIYLRDEQACRCILFSDKFEKYIPFLMDGKEQAFYHEIRNFIQNSNVKSPKAFATKIYQKLTENPKFLAYVKEPDVFFNQLYSFLIQKYGTPMFQMDFGKKKFLACGSISEKLNFFRMFEETKIKDLRETAKNLQVQYDFEMNQWKEKNLPHKYQELKNNVKIYIYNKLNQIMRSQYQDEDLITYGLDFKNYLFQIYQYIVKKRNYVSVNQFYQFLSQSKQSTLKISSEFEIEFPNEKEEKKPKSNSKTKFQKIKSFFSSLFQKGDKLNYVPRFDKDEQEKRMIHKDYLYHLGKQNVESIIVQFQSLFSQSKWKEEMMEEYPILSKNPDDITVSDLKEFFNLYDSFFEEVERERKKSYFAYDSIQIPKVSENNFFLSLFQKYVNVDFEDYEKMSLDTVKYLFKVLRGILMDYQNQNNPYISLENLLPDMKEQVIQTYFDALQYVSSGKSRN